MSDLRGEMTVVGTLERKLRGSEQWSLLDAMGMGNLPNAQEVVDSLQAITELEGNVVGPPAAILKPVAIFR